MEDKKKRKTYISNRKKKNISSYQLSIEQVNAILELKLQKLTAYGISEIETEIKKLSEMIIGFNKILNSKKELYKLISNELENISAELSSSMNSTIKFDHKVDQSLIGGLKLQLGSFMIDTSIKNKLKKYKQRMLEN